MLLLGPWFLNTYGQVTDSLEQQITVLETMKEVVSAHAKVLNHPVPRTLFDGFGDSSLNFRVLFWVHFEESLSVKSEIGVQIFDALHAAGIEIPIPQRVITMRPESDAPTKQ